jgi:hypothetical protein
MLRSLFDFNKSVLVINGTESREILNRRGLLQGSSLSPILFNHFINDLILKLDGEVKLCTLGVETNCLFFADDAALHACTAQDLQLLLDICDCWARRNGIRFAPAKCAVLNENQDACCVLANERIPQESQFKYLGLIFNHAGIDLESSVFPRVTAMRQMCKWMSQWGMYANGWRPESNLTVYKTFLRSIMEYGTPVELLPSKTIDSMQKAQNEALRIVFSAGSNTSIGALHSLTAIPPIKTRNSELNAKFFSRVMNRKEKTLIGDAVQNAKNRNIQNSFWSKCKSNPFWGNDEIEFQITDNKKILSRRHQAICSFRRYGNNVAASIAVQENCKPNKLIQASWLERKVQRNIIQWRLGRVAFHQDCCCGSEVSRKHGLECSGVEQKIRRKYPGLVLYNDSTNILDNLLENIEIRVENAAELQFISDMIEEIRMKCLGWRKNAAGELIRPEDDDIRRNPIEEFDVP